MGWMGAGESGKDATPGEKREQKEGVTKTFAEYLSLKTKRTLSQASNVSRVERKGFWSKRNEKDPIVAITT